MPSVEEKTLRPKIGKTFLIIGVIEHYKLLLHPEQTKDINLILSFRDGLVTYPSVIVRR
jgi:hypothetical protein